MPQQQPRGGPPRPAGQFVDEVVRALVPITAPIGAVGADARRRRTVAAELERQIQRALWRAERRGRPLPRHVRQSASWVNAQRRRIAYELTRALRSLGAGDELAAAIAAKACQRFPRDGVVLADAELRPERPEAPRRPRAAGTNPRATGTNPRARGTSPRQQRAQRERLAAADLSGAERADAAAIAPALEADPPPPPTAAPAAPPAMEPVTWSAGVAQLRAVRELIGAELMAERLAGARGHPERLDGAKLLDAMVRKGATPEQLAAMHARLERFAQKHGPQHLTSDAET